MTEVEKLAAFVERSRYEDLSAAACEQLKTRVLDALGCAIGALDGEPIGMIRDYLTKVGGNPCCTLIGGGATAPDRAALYNSALVRYLDFNDSYLAPKETCHPSDNLGAILAATEYAGGSGRDLLTALAVAYQVQCRLSDVAPVRQRGFDHTTQGSYSVAAGVAKALGLDAERTANAIAISGTAFNALRVTRTGQLSHWKGLAYPNTCFTGVHAALLAASGITGPAEVFEGNKGFMDSIAGQFSIDWGREDLERVTRTSIKAYNAEFHSQSAVEAALELQRKHGYKPADIKSIDVETFQVAYDIIGGGEEGDKQQDIRTKEQADHSLPYILAVALLDGQVLPEQYRPERIAGPDVQDLLRKVAVRPRADYSARFPGEMPCRLRVNLAGGAYFEIEKSDYEGFFTRPMDWGGVVAKFDRLSEGHTDGDLRRRIVATIENLENTPIAELTGLLAKVDRKEQPQCHNAMSTASPFSSATSGRGNRGHGG